MAGTATASRYDVVKKIFLACHWHSLRSILSGCEVCGVKSVGGDNVSMRIPNISKWQPKSKGPTLY